MEMKYRGRWVEHKLKTAIFHGPQIKQLINEPHFQPLVNEIESCTWTSFVLVAKNFLGNKKKTTKRQTTISN